jgi:hypothetical protein
VQRQQGTKQFLCWLCMYSCIRRGQCPKDTGRSFKDKEQSADSSTRPRIQLRDRIKHPDPIVTRFVWSRTVEAMVVSKANWAQVGSSELTVTEWTQSVVHKRKQRLLEESR